MSSSSYSLDQVVEVVERLQDGGPSTLLSAQLNLLWVQTLRAAGVCLEPPILMELYGADHLPGRVLAGFSRENDCEAREEGC